MKNFRKNAIIYHMILIVGLGNPGGKYADTPHNVGFKVLDEFRKRNNFPGVRFSKKFKAFISENNLPTSTGPQVVTTASPQTFMNVSGASISFLDDFYKIKPENNMIVHDDIDLPIGKIKISKGHGSAGHKGVESIVKALGTQNFIRVRVGIMPEKGKPKDVERFVVKNFGKKEQEKIKKSIEKSVDALDLLLKEGVEKAMNEYNQ